MSVRVSILQALDNIGDVESATLNPGTIFLK